MSQEREVSLPLSRSYLTNAPGKIVYVSGVISRDPYRFEIDLPTTAEGDSDIALHISIQFDENAVICSSKEDGTCGQEKRAATFPLQPEGKFLLTITTTEETYEIIMNEAHVYSFKHRVPPQSVKRFDIDQQSQNELPSVTITQVSVTGSWTRDSLDGQPVILMSRASTVPEKNIKVASNATTVKTSANTGDRVQFTMTRVRGSIYSLRNVYHDDRFLTIRENRLFADVDSSYDQMYVTQTSDDYYTFESKETPGSYIGVNGSGTVVRPNQVSGDESHFSDGNQTSN